jgi:hypothetical protein
VTPLLAESVETHAFLESFADDKASAFVVRVEQPRPAPPTARARLAFAEIYGAPGCYCLFETRAAAEFQCALGATGARPVDRLTVQEVRVANIRDYQVLHGFKTVFLINRDRQGATSPRLGDLPLAARTSPPFVRPPRPATAPTALQPAATTPAELAPAPPPERTRRRPSLDLSNLSADPASTATPAADTAPTPARSLGLVARLCSRFRA